MSRKGRILDQIDDRVSDLLYYDRKEDEDLPVGAIEAAIAAGEITVEDMVSKFADCLEKGLRK